MTRASWTVRVSGFSSARTSPRDVWKVRRRVGYVFQDFRLLPGRTAADNVGFALEVTGTPAGAITNKVQRLLSQVGLAAKFGAQVEELSGGERQRVAIARALYHSPEVMIFDEATSALDTKSEKAIQNTIYGLKGKLTLIIIAHRLSTVDGCDEIIWLENGRIRQIGPPEKTLTHYKQLMKEDKTT